MTDASPVLSLSFSAPTHHGRCWLLGQEWCTCLMLQEIQSPSVRQDRCFHSEGYLSLSREERQPPVLLISGPSPVCLHVPSHVLWWLMSVHFCNSAYRKTFLCIYRKTDLCVAPRWSQCAKQFSYGTAARLRGTTTAHLSEQMCNGNEDHWGEKRALPLPSKLFHRLEWPSSAARALWFLHTAWNLICTLQSVEGKRFLFHWVRVLQS